MSGSLRPLLVTKSTGEVFHIGPGDMSSTSEAPPDHNSPDSETGFSGLHVPGNALEHDEADSDEAEYDETLLPSPLIPLDNALPSSIVDLIHLVASGDEADAEHEASSHDEAGSDKAESPPSPSCLNNIEAGPTVGPTQSNEVNGEAEPSILPLDRDNIETCPTAGSAQLDGVNGEAEQHRTKTRSDSLDGFISPAAPRSPKARCGSPLIKIVTPERLPTRPTERRASAILEAKVKTKLPKRKRSFPGVRIPMVYNEWGELVPEETIDVPPISDQLSSKQLLRIIAKGYRHELRQLCSKLINPSPEGGGSVLVQDQIWTFRLSTWDLRLYTPASSATPGTPETGADTPFSPTQRRVLELGCSDGDWCFAFKEQAPDWVVNGVDDTDHWACFMRGVPFNDFAKVPNASLAQTPSRKTSDYFSGRTPVQTYPEFTVRNLNQLTSHEVPIPCNFYEFIRGREIFDRVENFKMFLEDIRSMLKPDGVVEFIELDPRPRIQMVVNRDEEQEVLPGGKRGKHRSTAPTDWTDRIADRFKNPHDMELATNVPGWSDRVKERLDASFRPRDGVTAANLKSWLEGAGFWDVKEYVLPIPVGGTTKTGGLVKQYLLYQLQLENEIPKLRDELPKVEVEEFDNGRYHLNIHVVTGRKPINLRTGDIMLNGHRTEITSATNDAMARFDAIKSSQWKRFDLEGNLTGIMQNLTTLPGAPQQVQLPTNNHSEDSMRHSELPNPFNSPPFVTVKELEHHISESGSEKEGRLQTARTGLARLG